VANNGPATATGVTGTDLLPAGLTFVSATPSQGTYSAATGAWTVGTLANGANVTLQIQATVAGSSAMSNTATVTASGTDPVPSNNSATVTVTPSVPVPTLPFAVLILLAGTLAALAARSLRLTRSGGRA
jgi:Domain of unknown function DUF11